MGMAIKTSFLALAVALVTVAGLNERDHQARIAKEKNAEAEVRLWDNSRVDLVEEEIAWEIDWARKWPEAVGQSLFYAIIMDKKPGIILLSDGSLKDIVYSMRCQAVCARHGIKLEIRQTEKK